MKSIQASRIPLCCAVQILIHEEHQNPYANKQTIKQHYKSFGSSLVHIHLQVMPWV
jgi:hypothetical protein